MPGDSVVMLFFIRYFTGLSLFLLLGPFQGFVNFISLSKEAVFGNAEAVLTVHLFSSLMSNITFSIFFLSV